MQQVKLQSLDCLKEESSSSSAESMAVLMLHGYGANMNDLFGLAAFMDPSKKFDWYFPNAPIDLAMNPFFESRAWFPIDMAALEAAMQAGTFRDFKGSAHEQFFKSLELLESIVDELSQKYSTLVIGGFSQGAMLSSHLALRNSEKFKAALLFSAVLVDEEQYQKYPIANKDLKIFQSHGKQDPILPYAGAMELKTVLDQKQLNPYFVEFSGQHEIPQLALEGASQVLHSIY